MNGYFWLVIASVFFAMRSVDFVREPSTSSLAWMSLWAAIALFDLRRVIVDRRKLRDGRCPCKADAE